MTEYEQRDRISEAANLLGEAAILLEGVQSLNPGQPLAFRDLWFTANLVRQEVRRSLYTLNSVRGPNKPRGYEEGEDK